jgi:AcrR family transcriptional regulator
MQNKAVKNKQISGNPKWRRKPKDRPGDILDGALIEFGLRGFAGARIEDIAKHAGLSKGTVYLYFTSKEEMLKALVSRSVTPIAQTLTKIATHIDNQDQKASDIMGSMLAIMAERLSAPNTSSIPLLIISEAGNFPELAAFYREEVIDAAIGALSIVLKYGVETGEYRKTNLESTVRTLLGAIIMQVIWNGTFAKPGEETLSYGDLVKSHLDIFLNGISLSQEK